jgi:hypothetical protein
MGQTFLLIRDVVALPLNRWICLLYGLALSTEFIEVTKGKTELINAKKLLF